MATSISTIPRRTKTSSAVAPVRKQQGILIVGDWIIDHYWFIARHNSDISAFTGFNHYKISSKPGEPIVALCGAGHTAQVIYHLNEPGPNKPTLQPYKIYGLGYWHEDETPSLADLLYDQAIGNKHYAHARFGGKFSLRPAPSNVEIRTMAATADTIKVIRLYQHAGAEYEQLSRIDWDRRDFAKYHPQQGDFIDNYAPPAEVSAIVVHDLGKGVITEGLISRLSAKFPTAYWYVRSKVREQKWVPELNKAGRLMLNVVGPETVALQDPWNRWIADNKPTHDVMTYLNGMPGKVKCVVTPKHEVIIKSELTNRCLVGGSADARVHMTRLGWCTTFFSRFAFEMIQKENVAPATDEEATASVTEMIKYADVAPRVIDPFAWKRSVFRSVQTSAMNWETAFDEWEKSSGDRGIIPPGPIKTTKRLELWRATALLPKYIACIGEKKEMIKRIGNAVTTFRNQQRPSTSVSLLLTADPGAGKSTLIKSLAEVKDFSIVQSNITQMVHREELLHLFDAIATRQANSTRPVMVYVDEINATVESDHVFSAFLAPLEDNRYLRQGRGVSLRPCVWIVVGTAGKEEDVGEYAGSDKYGDFLSRMTMKERMDYAYFREVYGTKNSMVLSREARLEQVYLGITLLCKVHPDLTSVEEQVLDSFYELDPETLPARFMRRRAGQLRNVQDGRITKENCSTWDKRDWSGNADMIEIA